MKLKHIFNILMYSFLLIVPLMPEKAKILFIPLSSDFIIGGFAILIGGISLIVDYRNNRESFNIFRNKNIMILTILIGIFVIISLASTIWSIDKTTAVLETVRFLEYAFIFYLVLLNADETFISRGFMLFYIAMLISALYGVAQFAFNLSNFDVGGFFGRGRVFGRFENPNYWGAAVNMVIYYPLIRLIENKSKNKTIDALVFLVFFANLLLSFTRGSWLGFGLGLVFLAVIRYRRMLLALPVFGVVAMIVPFIRERLLLTLKFQDTTLGRIKLWEMAWHMFKDHPLLGVGNGNYRANYFQYLKKYPKLTNWKEVAPTVHNSFLKMFTELGILGGVIFAAIYGMLFYITFQIYRRTQKYKIHSIALLGFWIAYLFQNMLNNLIFIPQLNVLVWVVTALLFKGLYLESQEGKI